MHPLWQRRPHGTSVHYTLENRHGEEEKKRSSPQKRRGDGRGVRFVHISKAALGDLTGCPSACRAEAEAPVWRLRVRLPFSSRSCLKRTDGLEITRGGVIYLLINIFIKKERKKKKKNARQSTWFNPRRPRKLRVHEY